MTTRRVLLLLLVVAMVAGASRATAVPCGPATGFPLCDGECLPGEMCGDAGGLCACVPAVAACVDPANPNGGPVCYGDCADPAKGICATYAGGCKCVGDTSATSCTLPTIPVPPGGGVFTGSTLVAANTTTGTCGGSGPELVYEWTPTTSGTALIDTCASATNFDTVLYIRSDNCTSGSEIGCDDNSCALSNSSMITVTVTAGTTYYSFVDGAGGGTSAGSFVLTVPSPL